MIVNGITLAVSAAVLVWAAFNIYERIDYVMLAQIPPIAMMFLRKLFRPGDRPNV
jgi:hypothetical protein